jgi:hypothetical protein
VNGLADYTITIDMLGNHTTELELERFADILADVFHSLNIPIRVYCDGIYKIDIDLADTDFSEVSEFETILEERWDFMLKRLDETNAK